MKRHILLLLSILLFNITYSQNSYTVNTVGMTFSPDTINCYVGDTIHFVLGATHNAVEVDQLTYISNGSTANGGFNFGFGATDYLITTNNQTYYYVCQPHVGMGMKGVIIASIPTGNLDCNGIANGTSLTDDCGDCQQAYIYDFVTHTVTLLDDTLGITLAATEMLVMPDNPMNPYWNANCIIDCNGIVDGSSIMDSCGVCQQSYIYDFITHTVTLLDDTFGITLGATETLVMANNPMNPYWNMATINTISYDTLVSSDTTIIWNNISLTASGDYVDSSLIAVSGCDSIANINFTLDNALTIENITENTEVVKIIDVLGRECKEKLYNTPLFYIYNNGKIEKKIILKSE